MTRASWRSLAHLNALSKSAKSTLYTAETAKGPLQDFAANVETPLKAAEDAWNSRDAARVSLAYTQDTVWRNRDEIFVGRDAVVEFLTRKWVGVANYKLVKNLWCYDGNRIAVRFTYEYQRVSDGQWFRCHGNELWQFDEQGYMQHRDMSGNDIPIDEKDRLYSS
ncbi:hypothetical protein AeMF1_009902 [Aphanomyces euteiches]|nr:hypothetical protein AeMF1_009901 [Aphanomyces euteiches]KAH9116134.1 hypothetical protein AeMF1_009902 [Aphanomyces euteiches]KAH9164335.1 hypothetical protein AeNC1_018680 [Aphanomyces euteiches]KAH9164336.1 hypothetical protein AeNC1_018681 [Aphanomyces euteiches]KAH9194746.1 hypothetical protein AeNC1_003296 [Aphanomyces euteiches]